MRIEFKTQIGGLSMEAVMNTPGSRKVFFYIGTGMLTGGVFATPDELRDFGLQLIAAANGQDSINHDADRRAAERRDETGDREAHQRDDDAERIARGE